MVPKLFFLYAFPSNFYQLLSSCTSCILLFFVVLFLKVHVPRAEHVLWLLPFCYPLSFPGRDVPYIWETLYCEGHGSLWAR